MLQIGRNLFDLHLVLPRNFSDRHGIIQEQVYQGLAEHGAVLFKDDSILGIPVRVRARCVYPEARRIQS